MLLKEFKNHFSQQLATIYPKNEVDSFFFLLIEKELDLQRIDLALNNKLSISEEKFKHLSNALSRLKSQEPIQYILGETTFFDLHLNLSKDTLIPRPETEELVEWIINDYKNSLLAERSRSQQLNENMSILDIGTGSGCIPISLKKNIVKASVSAIDVSENALAIAIENATINDVDINYIQQDILTAESLDFIANKIKQSQNINEVTSSKTPQNDIKFDIIVSNPPYVRELEKEEINPNVLDNEPHIALFVKNNDPLLFYKKIADLAKSHLKPNGLLYFEINQYLGKETVSMLSEKGFTTELRKDLFGNDRMIKSTIIK